MILYYTLGGILIIVALGIWRSYRLSKEVVLLGKGFEALEQDYESFIQQKWEQLRKSQEEIDWEIEFLVAEALQHIKSSYTLFIEELESHFPAAIKIDYKAIYFPNLQVHCESGIYGSGLASAKISLSEKDKSDLKVSLREAVRADLELRVLDLKKELNRP